MHATMQVLELVLWTYLLIPHCGSLIIQVRTVEAEVYTQELFDSDDSHKDSLSDPSPIPTVTHLQS